MALADKPEKIPSFQDPSTFLSPQISNLLKGDGLHIKEDGIAFNCFKRVSK